MALLRPAAPTDVDALLELERAGSLTGLAHVFPPERYPFPVEQIRARWTQELADPATDVFVAVSGDEVVGYAATRGAQVLHFGTAVPTWGSGLAATVHEEVLEHLAAHGHSTVWLRVLELNLRAIRFYERRGWVPTDAVDRLEFPPYPVVRRFELSLGAAVHG